MTRRLPNGGTYDQLKDLVLAQAKCSSGAYIFVRDSRGLRSDFVDQGVHGRLESLVVKCRTPQRLSGLSLPFKNVFNELLVGRALVV